MVAPSIHAQDADKFILSYMRHPRMECVCNNEDSCDEQNESELHFRSQTINRHLAYDSPVGSISVLKSHAFGLAP